MAQVFDSERKSRAEVVSVIKEYFVKLDKEPDKGVGVLTELCDLLKIKPKVKVDHTLFRLKKDFKISENIGESLSSGKWDSERLQGKRHCVRCKQEQDFAATYKEEMTSEVSTQEELY